MNSLQTSETHLYSVPFSFEMLFALFLFAGVFNQAEAVAWVPINITAIFVGLSGIGAIITLARGTRPTQGGIVLTALFIAFVVYALISLWWSPSNGYAYNKALRLVVATTWALAGSALIIASERRRVVRFMIIVAWFGSFTAISTLLTAAGVMANPSANYLIAGRVIGLGMLVLVWQLFASTDILRRVVAVIGLLISAVALVVGGGRTPFVATAIVGVGLIGVFTMRQIQGEQIKQKTITDGGHTLFRWAITGVISVVGILIAGVVLVIGIVPRTITRLLTISTAPTSSLGLRLGYWGASVQEFSTAPVFGHGLGSWPVVTPGVTTDYPHNIILEVGVELGATGLILLALVVGFGVFSALRTMRGGARPVGWLVFALVGFMAINVMISGDINDNRYLFPMVGLLVAPAIGEINNIFMTGHQ